jgi:hypothetical protein
MEDGANETPKGRRAPWNLWAFDPRRGSLRIRDIAPNTGGVLKRFLKSKDLP